MRLSAFIIENKEFILQEWEDFARTITPPALSMDSTALRDHASFILDTIVLDMDTAQSPQEQTDKSRGEAPQADAPSEAQTHAADRLAAGYTIHQLISEYRAIRASVLRLWAVNSPAVMWSDAGDVTRFNEAVDQALAESVVRYSELVESTIQAQKLAEVELRQSNTAQLQAANQELEAFSYSVAHDLRSPLSTIDGFTHLLARTMGEAGGAKSAHYLGRIREGVQQMGVLIDGLLSLAKMSRETLHCGSVDLSAIARQAARDCREQDPGRQVQIDIQDGMEVYGDARLLSVVIQNLLGNAWKFTSRQDAASIEIGRQAEKGGETRYFVRDNGAGFDMAYADKLFGTFERLHAVSDFPGTGIGLATVRRVIDRHGGRVWAEGKENEGATFYFTLPPDLMLSIQAA